MSARLFGKSGLDHLEDAPLAAAYLDREGRILRGNAHFVTLLGCAVDAVKKRLLSDLVGDETEARELQSALQRQWSFALDLHLRIRGGDTPLFIRLSGHKPKGQEGTLIYLTDLSDFNSQLEAARAALEDLRQRYEIAVDGAMGVWEWHVGAETVYHSPYVRRILGYPEGQYQPTLEFWQSIIHPEDQAHYGTRLNQQLREGKAFDLEYRVKTADGDYIWLHDRGSLMRDEDGQPVRMAGSLEDVTARVHFEQDLKASRKQMATQAARMAELAEDLAQERNRAESAAKAKADFLATMSHEIRTPLNSVIGMTGLLVDTELDEEQRRYARAARRSGEHLLHLVNDILDFSKLEAGKMTLEAIPFDLHEGVEDVLGMMRESAKEKGLSLRLDWDDAIFRYLRGDIARLRQVLLNLVGNAIKFTEKGEVCLRIESLPAQDGEQKLYFSVEDTGIGIAEDKIGTLFQEFQQADTSTTRRFGGTGLGLVISQRIVHLMGGEIMVKSVAGQGSVFSFSSCFERASEDERQKLMRDAELAAQDQAQTTPLRVLIAEDSVTNQMLIRAMLEKLGHRADIVTNGIEAIAAVRELPYDIVLMDSQMPVMDGITATQQIRALSGECAQLPIIALTADVMGSARERFLKAGMDDYLTKPVEVGRLRAVLRQWGTKEAVPE